MRIFRIFRTTWNITLGAARPAKIVPVSRSPIITRVRAGEVGVAHYPKWRRSLLIRAETRDFHSRRGMGEERSLGDDAHL